MQWKDFGWLLPAFVVVGASALTAALVTLPDLGAGLVAALVGARVLVGLGQWAFYRRISAWWNRGRWQPHLAGAA